MSLNQENVRVAVTGAVYAGTSSAVLPTSADESPSGFTDLGYVGEDGVTETRDRSTDTLKAWQNAAVVRTLVTEGTITYQCVLLETKRETIEEYYFAPVASDGSVVIDPTTEAPRKPYVIDVIDGDDFIRAVIGSGAVTDIGDQVYASGEAIGYDVTITAYQGTYGETGSEWTGSVKKFYSSLADPEV